MRTVTCPFCHEKGRIPDTYVGKRIKCGKCENRFLVSPSDPKEAGAAGRPQTTGAAPELVSTRLDDAGSALFDSLDDKSWFSISSAAIEEAMREEPAAKASAAPSASASAAPVAARPSASTISPPPSASPAASAVATAPAAHAPTSAAAPEKPAFSEPESDHPPSGIEYKILSQKDKWFDGKFDLTRLEQAINHYSHRGWRVRSMATAHVQGFSGPAKEEIIVLLER